MFLDLNLELQEEILIHCRLEDVARFSQVCKAAHALVYQSLDSHLWRELFCAAFDDPRATACLVTGSQTPMHGFDWKASSQAVTRAAIRVRQRQANSQDLDALLDLLSLSQPYSSQSADRLIESKNVDYLTSLFEDTEARDHALCKNRFHTQAAVVKLQRQASASIPGAPIVSAPVPYLMSSIQSSKLSVCYGLHPQHKITTFERGAARARVYDLTRYKRRTDYGPFHLVKQPESDAVHEKPVVTLEVDWQQMEAIMLVASTNAIELFGKHQIGKLFRMPASTSCVYLMLIVTGTSNGFELCSTLYGTSEQD